MNSQIIKLKIICFIILYIYTTNAYSFTIDGLYYGITDEAKKEVAVTGGDKSLVDIVIPSTVVDNGIEYSVKSICDCAFYVEDLNWPRPLKTVTISEGVTAIGRMAFYDCCYLSSVVTPHSLEVIDYRAFWRCTRLLSINLPGVTTISEEAFEACTSLTSVTATENVSTIGKNAFNNCSNLTSIEFKNVSYIDERAFWACSGLTFVKIPNVSTIGKNTFDHCTALSSIDCKNVSYIGSGAFGGCTSLTAIDIPNVSTIGRRTFYGCSGLTSVTISNSVTSIEGAAFQDCTGLASITIPSSLTSIETDAFYNCTGLTKVEFSSISSMCNIQYGNSYANPLYYAGNLYIKGKEITSLDIPDNVTSIPSHAFEGCTGLTSLDIGNGVVTIGAVAFSGCTSLKDISLGKKILSITDNSFSGCTNISSITYYCKNVASVINRDSLTSVIIGDGVESILNYTFEECKQLKSVEISNSLTSIGQSAFWGCSSLASINIPNSVTSIGNAAFSGCSGLSSIDIPNSITTIEMSTFSGCTGASSINIPSSVKSIGSYAFNGCTNLSSIVIPNSVTAIDDYAFANNTNLSLVKSQIEQPYLLGDNVFKKISSEAVLLVPKGTKDSYKSNDSWIKYFKNIEEYNITISVDDINYTVVSEINKTVNLANGDYGNVLSVPATIFANDSEWRVVGVENEILSNTDISALFWNAEQSFSGKFDNPNLLLYVNDKKCASSDIKNVIINNEAEEIELHDTDGGNNFYCPQAFTAKKVSYVHNYSMKTGYNSSQGWESIVLPFNVTNIRRISGEEIVPFSAWNQDSNNRPFWLYSLNDNGWNAESRIKANTPYIISMPNNDEYDAAYNLSGDIQFIGENVQIETSENLGFSKSGDKKYVPNYQNHDSSSDIYALNVNNLWSKNTDSSLAEGSAFIRDSRQVRPFEAYMTIDSGGGTTRSINIFDDNETTGIMNLPLACKNKDGVIRVYSLSGMLLKQGNDEKILNDLPKGVYVVNGKKIVK